MMVFRNWFNEQHSKQTSQKVRAVRKACAENGQFLGTYAAYGYKKSPENKHKLVIDENTAPNARMIFEMRASGASFRAIVIHLNELGILPPSAYYYETKGRQNPKKTNRYWNDVTIKVILRNEVYIGNIVQLKTGTVSYKNHKLVNKPEEEWVRSENTHEALIPMELWNRVQELDKKAYKPRKREDGTASIFSGLMYCADCGFKMKSQNERRKSKVAGGQYAYSAFICGTYARSGKKACTVHTINETMLKEVVIEHIRKHARMLEYDEKRIVENILRLRGSEAETARDAYFREIKSHRDRLSMLDKLIAKLYEDRFNGVIPEATFHTLIQKYEQERVDRSQMAENLENRVRSIRQETSDAKTWAKLIRQHTEIETLDAETLLLLIDRIIVGEAQKVDGKKVCDIKIIYNYVGDVDFLSETAVVEAEAEVMEVGVLYGQAV